MKDLKDHFIGMNIKRKVGIKPQQINIYIFLNQILLDSIDYLFVSVYLNRDSDVKQFKTRKYFLPKGIIKNYNVIIIGKNFYDQPIDSDKK